MASAASKAVENNHYKLRRAAQALIKNHTTIVTSGSGMLADSGVPILRGTAGIWKNFPVLKKNKITFEKINTHSFF